MIKRVINFLKPSKINLIPSIILLFFLILQITYSIIYKQISISSFYDIYFSIYYFLIYFILPLYLSLCLLRFLIIKYPEFFSFTKWKIWILGFIFLIYIINFIVAQFVSNYTFNYNPIEAFLNGLLSIFILFVIPIYLLISFIPNFKRIKLDYRLLIILSIFFFIISSNMSYKNYGCYWEGCIAVKGFPISYMFPNGAGGTATSYQIIIIDMILIYTTFFLIYKFIIWFSQKLKSSKEK